LYASGKLGSTHLICLRGALRRVVSDEKKTVSSTGGMKTSVQTSTLLQHRAAAVVPGRVAKMEKAVVEKDFETFARLTMEESNSFHATCLDTFPPIFYLNDTSRAIIAAVHQLNAAAGRTVACYTFDAGPNAVLFLEEADVPMAPAPPAPAALS
jgi:diphosphomevalonate decarboxylase